MDVQPKIRVKIIMFQEWKCLCQVKNEWKPGTFHYPHNSVSDSWSPENWKQNIRNIRVSPLIQLKRSLVGTLSPFKDSWAKPSWQELGKKLIGRNICLIQFQGRLNTPLVCSSSSVWYGHCPIIKTAGPNTCIKNSEVMSWGTLWVLCVWSGTSICSFCKNIICQ